MRFSKGTTDHDGDGKMGGSLKETDMTKQPAKATAKKPAAKPNPETQPRAARKDALVEAQAQVSEASPDPQSGMEPTSNTEEAERRVAEQFKAADAVGQPRTEKEQAAVDEATLNRQIRGY